MGQSMGKVMGPLEMAGGVGASLLGAPQLGIPLAMGGLGSTVGRAAGGSQGQLLGSLAGGAAGLGLGGLSGVGPLASTLGGTGAGQGLQSALQGTALGKLMGIAGPAAGAPGSSVAAGVTPTPTGAPGAFPAPGAAPTPEGIAYQQAQQAAGGPIVPAAGNQAAAQNAQGFANAFMSGDPLSLPMNQIAAGATPAAAPAAAATPATAGAGGQAANKQGLMAYLQQLGGAGPALSIAQQLMGGGGQGQQAPRPPAARPAGGAPQAPPLNVQPTVTSVPSRASFTGGAPGMMTIPYGSDMMSQLQALRQLQGLG